MLAIQYPVIWVGEHGRVVRCEELLRSVNEEVHPLAAKGSLGIQKAAWHCGGLELILITLLPVLTLQGNCGGW